MKSLEEIKQMHTELSAAIEEQFEANKNDICVFSISSFGEDNTTMVAGNGKLLAESLTRAIIKLPVEVNMTILASIVTGCANHPEMKHQMPAALEGLSEFVKDIISEG